MDETNQKIDTGTTPGGQPLVGIVIIILVVLLGGLYFWKTKIERSTRMNPENQDEQTAPENTPES